MIDLEEINRTCALEEEIYSAMRAYWFSTRWPRSETRRDIARMNQEYRSICGRNFSFRRYISGRRGLTPRDFYETYGFSLAKRNGSYKINGKPRKTKG